MLCSSVLGSATEFVSESFKFIVLLELPQPWILEMVGWGQSDTCFFLATGCWGRVWNSLVCGLGWVRVKVNIY